jgi:hypothetical protein
MCFVGGWLRCLPRGLKINLLSTAFAGQGMGVPQVAEKIWFVSFMKDDVVDRSWTFYITTTMSKHSGIAGPSRAARTSALSSEANRLPNPARALSVGVRIVDLGWPAHPARQKDVAARATIAVDP